MLLIAAGSGVLLLTDVRPTGADGRSRPRIAILQQASTPVLDEGVRSMIDGLAEKGYREGETADITTYNAQGDLPTANAIAREITDGRFDLVITSSTPRAWSCRSFPGNWPFRASPLQNSLNALLSCVTHACTPPTGTWQSRVGLLNEAEAAADRGGFALF
jgi:hypothetical protein